MDIYPKNHKKYIRVMKIIWIWFLLQTYIPHPAESANNADTKPNPCSNSQNEEGSYISTGIGIGVGALVGVAAAPIVLPALGFTSGGVVAGSIAAGVQSAFYGGATTGAFAGLQSVGAAGLSAAGTTLAGTIGAGVGAAASKSFTDATDTPKKK